jgi:hypothetical protein
VKHLRLASPRSDNGLRTDRTMDLRCGLPDPAHEWEYSLYTWVASTIPSVRASRPLGHAPTLLGRRGYQEDPNVNRSPII